MFMMVFCMTLQGSLAATALCAFWRRGRGARPALAALATSLIPPLTLASASCLLLADDLLVWFERALILMLAALTGMLWLFGFVRVEEANAAAPGAPGERLYRSPSLAGEWWITLCALLQGAFLLTATWIAAQNFMRRTQFMAAVGPWLWLSLIAAALCGALLLAAALGATVAAASAAAPDDGGTPPVRSGRARPAGGFRVWGWCLIGLLLLRGAALAASLALWFYACPFPPAFFASRLLHNGFTLIFSRVVLGLVLPLFFMLFGLLAHEADPRPQCALQHLLPALIVMMLGEMLAAVLAAGLAGLAL